MLLVSAVLVIAVATAPSVGPLISGCGALATTTALVLTLCGTRRSRLLPPALLGVAGVSLAVTFAYEGPARSAAANWWTAETVALMMLIGVGVRWTKASTATALAVLLTATTTLSPLRITMNVVPPSSGAETLQLVLLWAILAMVAVGVGAYLRNLDARGREIAAAERRAERLRLARDLHDYAAHDVTAVVVLVEAAQVLAKEDPQQALELLPEIGAAGVHALEAMDHTVQLLAETPSGQSSGRDLRSSGERGLASRTAAEAEEDTVPRSSRGARRDLSGLAQLVGRFNRTDTPEAVLVTAEYTEDGVPTDVSAMGYRVIVEALTNVRRHAATASRVEILLRREEVGGVPALRVQVTDDAPRPAPGSLLPTRAPGAGGSGISGLAEQVAELGGTLTAGPAEAGGWRVAAVMPLAP